MSDLPLLGLKRALIKNCILQCLDQFDIQMLFFAYGTEFLFIMLYPIGVILTYFPSLLIQPVEIFSKIIATALLHCFGKGFYAILDLSFIILLGFLSIADKATPLNHVIKSTAKHISVGNDR